MNAAVWAGGLAVIAGSLAVSRLIELRADFVEARAEAQSPPIGKIMQVNGRYVHVYIDGEGPDLVLLHGAGGNLRDFTFDLFSRLTQSYRVIAFDRPGHGWTQQINPRNERPYALHADTPRDQAAFLSAAADQLGVKNPIVLGHSYGGAVALAWGILGGPSALVLVSSVAMPWPGNIKTSYRLGGSLIGGVFGAPLISAIPPKSYLFNALKNVFAPHPVPDGYARYLGVELAIRRDSLRANTRQVSTLRPEVKKMQVYYPNLNLPVELIHGEQDWIVPIDIHARPVSKLIPDANLVNLPDTGHMPHHTAPEAVIGAVNRAAGRANL